MARSKVVLEVDRVRNRVAPFLSSTDFDRTRRLVVVVVVVVDVVVDDGTWLLKWARLALERLAAVDVRSCILLNSGEHIGNQRSDKVHALTI